MILGYNTNGFAHHRLEDALEILAELGYGSVALTLDHQHLSPFDLDWQARAERIRYLLEKLQLRCVIETGARFQLDPRRKHQPTLLSATADERERRLDFLRRSVDIARILRADAVSFWSGAPADEAGPAEWGKRLLDGCKRLCDYAEAQQVRLAFESEPGMFIDTTAKFFDVLYNSVRRDCFGLTIDVGHLHCLDEPMAPTLRLARGCLWNIHIEDMRRGVHDHLMFGEGEMEFGVVFGILKEIDYAGGIHVELSRHSHDAVNTARKAREFLEKELRLLEK